MKLGLQINEGAKEFFWSIGSASTRRTGKTDEQDMLSAGPFKTFDLNGSLSSFLRNKRIVVANLFFKYRL